MVRLGLGNDVKEGLVIFRVLMERDLALSDKVKVGCVIEGIRKSMPYEIMEDKIEYFGGMNIEITHTDNIHAELLALYDCISYRFYPTKIYVSSQSEQEKVFMCGHCRQTFLEINQHIEIILINPDYTVKDRKVLHDVFPFHKDVDEKNVTWYKKLYYDGRM